MRWGLFDDADFLPDLIVANWSADNITVLRGMSSSSGSFGLLGSFPAGDAPSKPALADLDGDGMLDAVVASRGADSIAVLMGYCED